MTTVTQPVDPLLVGLKDEKKVLPTPNFTLGIVVSAIVGVIFGSLLQRGHVFEPSHIVNQMKFTQWFMVSMFLSAVASSTLTLAAIAHLHPKGKALVASSRKWVYNNYRGPVASILGGLVLGLGISLAGACPGTALIQVGAGVRYSLFTVLGGLLGAFIFSVVEPRYLKPSGILQLGMFSKPTFDLYFNKPFGFVALIVASLLFSIVAIVQAVFPWRSQFGFDVGQVTPLSYAWPPWLAGIFVGFLQLPLLLFAYETLGSSRAYCTVVGNALHQIVPAAISRNPYMCGAMHGLGNWSQVAFVVCAGLGSFLMVFLSNTPFGEASGFSPIRSLLGGILIVFGGRLGGGCTSGAGISGNSVLALNSPLLTISMFIGGTIGVHLF